jgi:hypothetical protein
VLQALYFETLACICSDALRAPRAADRFLGLALDRLARPPPVGAAATAEDGSAAARVHSRRFNCLCAAGDWQAAYAAVVAEPPSAAQLEHARVLVQRAAAAGCHAHVLAWTWPGVVVLEGAAGWCAAHSLAEAALGELASCAGSRQRAPDLSLAAAACQALVSRGKLRAAASAALAFLVALHAGVQGVQCAAAPVLRDAAAAIALAASALTALDDNDAWAPLGVVLPATAGWSSALGGTSGTSEVEAASLPAMHAEATRLQCLQQLLNSANDDDASAAERLTCPGGAVFEELLEQRLWDAAASLAQAAAPTEPALHAALSVLVGACAAECALAANECGSTVIDSDGPGKSVAWAPLASLLAAVESQAWLQACGQEAARGAAVCPPGALRLAAAKVLISQLP